MHKRPTPGSAKAAEGPANPTADVSGAVKRPGPPGAAPVRTGTDNTPGTPSGKAGGTGAQSRPATQTESVGGGAKAKPGGTDTPSTPPSTGRESRPGHRPESTPGGAGDSTPAPISTTPKHRAEGTGSLPLKSVTSAASPSSAPKRLASNAPSGETGKHPLASGSGPSERPGSGAQKRPAGGAAGISGSGSLRRPEDSSGRHDQFERQRSETAKELQARRLKAVDATEPVSIKPPELPPEVDEEVKHRNAFSQQFRVVCPNTSCNAKMKVMPEQLDRMLTCPICDKMFYLPCVHIECPNKKCDGAGYVPVHRLNTQLHCNVCKTQFYIDQGGRGLVTGEFTGEWVDPLYIPPPPKHKADIPERIIDWWSRLEKTTRTRVKLITALTLSSLLGFFVWWQFFGPKPKVPGEPLGRAQFVARAIMDNDVDKLRLVLDSKSNTSELREWLGLVRPKTWPKKLPMCNLECIESYKRSKFASYRVTYTTTYNPRPIMPPPEAELDEEATAEDESAEQGAEPIEGEDEFVEEEIVTEPVKIPKYSIVVTLVNRNDGGGYRLDMTECLRSVGKLKQ